MEPPPYLLVLDSREHSGARCPTELPGIGKIPRIRHATGPEWKNDLGNIKAHIKGVQARSRPKGWETWYWSHQAFEKYCYGLLSPREQKMFARIKEKYRNVQVDFFKLILMREFGGVWLDLRGAPVEANGEECADGMEGIVRRMAWRECANESGAPEHGLANIPAVTFMKGGGWKKDVFGGKYGEIMMGFFMSVPGHPTWQILIDTMLDAMEDHKDCTRRRYARDFEMWGGDGSMWLGPFAITHAVHS